jgi:hypothetical protein
MAIRPLSSFCWRGGRGGEAFETKDDSKKNAGHDVLIPQCIRYNQNQGNFRA